MIQGAVITASVPPQDYQKSLLKKEIYFFPKSLNLC